MDLPEKVKSFTLLQIQLKLTLALLCVFFFQNLYWQAVGKISPSFVILLPPVLEKTGLKIK